MFSRGHCITCRENHKKMKQFPSGSSARALCGFLLLLLGTIPMAKAEIATSQPAATTISSHDGAGTYEPSWASITSQYRVPEWYKDAKFGIFIHWGVYAVPAFHDEWYPRWMYKNDKGGIKEGVYAHHLATYGSQEKFGYKDFIPFFKAEKFDPKAWAELFKESGARYIVPVAEHHDGFSMYDSAINPWNSVKMGPHRDIIGELAKAIRSEGLHFGLSSQQGRTLVLLSKGGREFPTDVQDPKYARTLRTGKKSKTPDGKTKIPRQSRFWRTGWPAARNSSIGINRNSFILTLSAAGPPPSNPILEQFTAYYYNQGQ